MRKVLVVCEAAADALSVQALADRALVAEVRWLDGILDSQRTWVVDDGTAFIKWTTLKKRQVRMPAHGRYEGEKGEYAQARKALVYAALTGVDGVVLARDLDRKPRRRAFEDARASTAGRIAIALALPDPEREAWHMVGFEPADAEDQARLTAETKRLGKDPRRIAHTLAPGRDDAERGTKRVLDALTEGDRHREARCLTDLPLDELARRGEAVGLTAFLAEVRERLAPLFTAPA